MTPNLIAAADAIATITAARVRSDISRRIVPTPFVSTRPSRRAQSAARSKASVLRVPASTIIRRAQVEARKSRAYSLPEAAQSRETTRTKPRFRGPVEVQFVDHSRLATLLCVSDPVFQSVCENAGCIRGAHSALTTHRGEAPMRSVIRDQEQLLEIVSLGQDENNVRL